MAAAVGADAAVVGLLVPVLLAVVVGGAEKGRASMDSNSVPSLKESDEAPAGRNGSDDEEAEAAAAAANTDDEDVVENEGKFFSTGVSHTSCRSNDCRCVMRLRPT